VVDGPEHKQHQSLHASPYEADRDPGCSGHTETSPLRAELGNGMSRVPSSKRTTVVQAFSLAGCWPWWTIRWWRTDRVQHPDSF
jgi:hypothetical protein